MGLLLAFFFGLVPMLLFAWFIYWLDHYEKEPGILIGGVFTWGAVVAASGAFIINTVLGVGVYLFTGSEFASTLATGSLVAPFVEEALKGFAVLIVFLLFRREFDSILDGIVYASVVALGFAATENIYYIYTYGYLEDGFSGLFFLVFVRVILVGWQHPFYTSFIGIGLAIARLSKSIPIKFVAPALGMMIAVVAHSVHNTLASLLSGTGGMLFGTLLDWSGWFLMALFILWAIYREQRWIVQHLREEVVLGVITPKQYGTACSAWQQSSVRLSALFSGHFTPTNRFYQLCAELAHKKQQLFTLGEEMDNSKIVENLRAELRLLSPKVVS